MSDLGVAEIPVDEKERPLPPPPAPLKNALVDGPILRTLLLLAWPNVIALTAGTCVVIAETSYIGRLGVESLAAMALVFPTVILTMTMSGGAMGGGVASAIARALGAGDVDRASTLASHALLIGFCFGLVFMLGMLIFGPALLELLGGRGNVLAQAVAYTQIFFGGVIIPWLMNTMAGILRGTGNMKLPSLMMLSSAVCQIILGGTLGSGFRPDPAIRHAWRRRRVVDRLHHQHLRNVLVSVLGPRARRSQDPRPSHSHADVHRHSEGRRHCLFLAAAVGFDHQYLHPHAGEFWHRNPRRLWHRRAARIHADVDRICRRHCARCRWSAWPSVRSASRGPAGSAWIAGVVAFVSVGAVASFIAIFPDIWVNLFTDDASVRAASRQYLSTAAPMYAFLGLSTTCYFSSQGAAKVIGPVLAQSARLLFIGAGGWWLSTHDATAQNFFMLAAASMVLLGVLSCVSVMLTRWGPKQPVPVVRPALS